MKLKAFRESIRAAYRHYTTIQLLEQPQEFGPFVPSNEFFEASHDRGASYNDVYRAGLRGREYNFLLADYSFLQFGHTESGDRCELRFAFYPNPFQAFKFEEFLASVPETDASEETYESYLQALAEAPEREAITPVRYDLSIPSYRHLEHPAAHFHIGFHGASRWPVDKIVTPEVFSLMIAKLFYQDHWTGSARGDLDEVYCQRKVACVSLGEESFSKDERRQLFVT